MPYGLIASLILHAALLGWAIFTVEQTPPLVVVTPEPVEIAILADDNVTRLKQGERDSKVMEAEGKEGPAKEPPKKEAPKPTPPPPPVAAAPPPPPPVEPPKPEPPKPEPPKPEPPKPDPIAEKIQTAAAEPIPPPVKPDPPKADPIGDLAAAAAAAPPAPKPEPPKPPAPKPPAPKPPAPKPPAPAAVKPPPAPKPSFADLANTAIERGAPTSAPPKALTSRELPKLAAAAGSKSATATPNKGPAAGAKEGTDTRLTVSQADQLKGLIAQAVQPHWNINAGMEGANKLIVKLEFKMTRDGRLVENSLKVLNPQPGQQFQDAADGAIRAMVKGQPYTTLPQELYENGWAWSTFTFDPSQMFK